MFIPAASNMPPCICFTFAFSIKRSAIWVSLKGMNPCCNCATRAWCSAKILKKCRKAAATWWLRIISLQSYGADTTRAYLMFFSRWDMGGPWSSGGIDGTSRLVAKSFGRRFWNRRRAWGIQTMIPSRRCAASFIKR